MNRPATPFLVLGGLGILVGGVASAASAASPSYLSAWSVAYLVLVVGFAQVVLGLGQARLASHAPSGRLVAAEALAFNLANFAVLAGSFLEVAALTWIGAALLVAALALFIGGARGRGPGNRWLLYAYRAVIVILLVSAPIGLVLARARMG